ETRIQIARGLRGHVRRSLGRPVRGARVDGGGIFVAPDGGEVAAGFFKYIAAQLAHLAAAAALAGPGAAHEMAAVQLFEPGADPVSQAPEVRLGLAAKAAHRWCCIMPERAPCGYGYVLATAAATSAAEYG